MLLFYINYFIFYLSLFYIKFTIWRGLRQACPLSPLLFLLVIGGLCRLIILVEHEWSILGVKVSSSQSITHPLFVDDVLLFGIGLSLEWISFKDIITLFTSASRMRVSLRKSTLFQNNSFVDVLSQISNLFSYQLNPLEKGFKFFGYFLKPNGFEKEDWSWMPKKVVNRIDN